MNFTNLTNLMNHFVTEGYAPGNAIEVYLKGEKIYNYSCGYSDIESKKEMTGNEHLFLYSCSKVTTVTAALQLVEKGIIMLNDPLYDYIPEYKDMYIKTPEGEVKKATKDIKVLNLFNMTAGLTYDRETPAFKKAHELTNGKMNTDVVARCIASDPLSFEPGTTFQYSLCHDVLAGLVSIVTGMKFRDYVKENIFNPLEMNDSVYHLTSDIEKNMATQYTLVTKEQGEDFDIVDAQKNGSSKKGIFKDTGLTNSHSLGEEYDSGGAGIISTPGDYVKLAAALANYGTGINGERILAPGTVELMRTNTLDEQQIKTFNWKQLQGYGYGLGVRTMIDKVKGSSTGNLGEFGWGGAAGTSVYIDPEIGLAAVYAKHCLNPSEEYYQPRVRNVIYSCL